MLQNGYHVQNLLILTGIESIKDFAELASAVEIRLLPKFVFDQSENRRSQCHIWHKMEACISQE